MGFWEIGLDLTIYKMATAATAGQPPGDGENSPPRQNESTNNGNLPTGLLSVADSMSDMNLGQSIQVNRFLSAKNSVELHRSRARQFFPNQSLPSVLKSERPAAGHADANASAADYENDRDRELSQKSPQSHSGRNVNWADLRPSPACATLTAEKCLIPRANSNVQVTGVEESAEVSSVGFPVKTKESASHTSLYLNRSDISVDIQPLSVLHAPTKSHPFVSGQSTMDVEIEAVYKEFQGKDSSETRIRNPSRPRKYESSFPAGMVPGGGSPKTAISIEQLTENLEKAVAAVDALVNMDDGLHADVGEDFAERRSKTSMVFSPFTDVIANDSMTNYFEYSTTEKSQAIKPQSVYENYHMESNVPIPPVITDNIEIHLDVQPTPLRLPDAPSKRCLPSDYNYTGDDEVDFDTKPEMKVVNLDDVQVPTYSYVASTVTDNLRPLLVRNCKKDCRTWLWKSRRQREAALELQANNDLHGITFSDASDDSYDSSRTQPLTSGSKLDLSTYYS